MRWLARRSFGTLVALALGLVIVGALGSAVVAASVAGPGLFHDHLAQGGTTDPGLLAHVEMAYRSAGALTLAAALAAGLAVAGLVAFVLTRWVARSLRGVAATAAAVAAGDYGARVTDPHLGAEFEALAGTVNALAEDLGQVEATRRRLLSDLAHELRTPIAALTAYHEALADGVVAPDEAGLDVLRRHTARLARLADDIALVTTAEEGRLPMALGPVAPAELAEAAVRAAAPAAAAAGVTLTADLDGLGPGVTVRGDAERLGQVLANLLANALRHTPPGGQVVVAAASADRPGENPGVTPGVTSGVTSAVTPGVAVSVTDDGDGIAPEHLPHVFERFYRADPARDRGHGGSGIGLTIVQAIVAAHGGTVDVASDGPGRGTAVTLWLPAA
ncbi:MAG: HAMP domain-containing histidine kinase [Propionibacteriaceae bacterium]|jgi:signal transduction histidine kinase|nr:HAMP domain-containing histidine kinase [Propionibacteriaceae bacterium]